MVSTLRVDNSNFDFFKSYISPSLLYKLHCPNVLIIGAAEDKTAIGVMVVEIVKDVVNILWLFVTTVNRRRGVATMLLNDLEKAAKAEKIHEIRMAFSEKDDSPAIIGLLDKQGFEHYPVPEGGIYTICLPDIKWSVLEGAKTNERLFMWKDVPEVYLREYGNKLTLNQVEMVDLPFRKADYLHFSMAAMQGGGLTGVCLFKHVNKAHVELSFLRGTPASLGVMLRTGFEAIKSGYPPDTEISMVAAVGSGAKLLSGLAGETIVSQIFVGTKYFGGKE